MDKKIGSYAFLVVVALAIVAGLFPTLQARVEVTMTLAALGLVVGLLNITKKEVQGFLIASIALLLVGGVLPNLGNPWTNIWSNITVFVGLAATVVALKAVYDYASAK